jgi:hypothetical protein
VVLKKRKVEIAEGKYLEADSAARRVQRAGGPLPVRKA